MLYIYITESDCDYANENTYGLIFIPTTASLVAAERYGWVGYAEVGLGVL